MDKKEIIQVAVEGAKQAAGLAGGIFVTGLLAVGAAVAMSKSKAMTDETGKKLLKAGKAIATGISEQIANKERP